MTPDTLQIECEEWDCADAAGRPVQVMGVRLYTLASVPNGTVITPAGRRYRLADGAPLSAAEGGGFLMTDGRRLDLR